ncbi:MarR family winged helix-turn-helix transcriptional regulator [Oerskovia merdavium]|uniref:Winged helix-turn-helix transcriptional regulator n=1 Tax=Oerskovia merdavium TaxID=2762227 RepID=A0ABR8TUX0_9CELL|nr:MarR family winged helix-turn-helix transcriptional regulator [Oerskovia merdavium]MBD7979550.1 winged helix-turn-helix transcriptional regulator [Oerskovia merdavium]
MSLSTTPSLDAPLDDAAPPTPSPTQPLDVPVMELTVALEELNRAQREVSARLSRELDFPRASLGALRLLQRCGPLQVTELAHHLRVDLSVASRQVTHLAEAGLVERTACDDDRRARSVTLTPAGRAKVEETFALLTSRTAETFVGWTPEQLREAIRHLERLTEALSHT